MGAKRPCGLNFKMVGEKQFSRRGAGAQRKIVPGGLDHYCGTNELDHPFGRRYHEGEKDHLNRR
jgi:hypothetical protein